MNASQLQAILDSIHHVTIAVYGDFCLDAYWILDPQGGEISVETGLRTQAVREQYYSLGGASNVVANLAALNPQRIQLVGVTGDDIFGREMRRHFHDLNVDITHLITQCQDYDTVVFGKRYLNDEEQPRIDFGFFNQRSIATDDLIIANLRQILATCDALIFNQQVPGSISESFIHKANAVFDEFSDKIILLDSRHFGPQFRNIYRKTNDVEAAELAGVSVSEDESLTTQKLESIASMLFQQSGKPVFLTRGDRGILAVDAQGRQHHIPGIHFMKTLDTVGAGDTVISALAAALAAGHSVPTAAEFANLAAGVTVQKLFQTGTANREEILALQREVYYLHQPELAEDIRNAQYAENSNIEICYPLESLPLGHIKYVIFDHDGTISTLREGWPEVMEDVMLRCILGPEFETADASTVEHVRTRVREFIDMTTGIQTIVQMQQLAEMVQELGFVPQDQILDKFGYKRIYNDALMQVVSKRIRRIEQGELHASDFTIKGVVEFIEMLHQNGLVLYMASGTDHEDVLKEAETLGYAHLFNGGIYGAVGDVTKFSKRLLIENIIQEHHLNGPELAVFGDGPVELQECRKYNGIAIGVASDELRRFGLNTEKRQRLIKAGAQLVIPDYSQHHHLFRMLFNHKSKENRS